MKVISINPANIIATKNTVLSTNKPNLAVADSVSFKGNNLSDDEKCGVLLDKDGRFSDFEKNVIKEKLSTYRSVLPKNEVLEKLLAIKSEDNEDKKLDTLNIINYLNATSGYYPKEQMPVMDIVAYKFSKQNNNNDDIRGLVFFPLKNIKESIYILPYVAKIDNASADEKLKNQRVLTKTFDIFNNMYQKGINLFPCISNISCKLLLFPSEKYDDAFEKALLQRSYKSRDPRDLRTYIDNMTRRECAAYIK